MATKTWGTILLFVLTLGCSTNFPKIPAEGSMHGHMLRTTVDSEIARYYLEAYLADKKTNTQFDKQIETALESAKTMPLWHEKLSYLSNQLSVDFAALYLAKSILEDLRNQRAQSVYEESVRRDTLERALPKLPSESSSYLVLFVPGLFYQSEKENGADLSNPRRVVTQMGLENRFIEIDQSGTVEHNAVLIEQAILHHSGSGKGLILVSASKGGPEVALALSTLEKLQQPHQVKAWINIGGLLQGSALADSALEWPKRVLVRFVFWWKGWDLASLESITTQQSQTRFQKFALPKQVLIINYIGIPLSGNISQRAMDGYLDLRHQGPNDGLTLIPDEIAPNNRTIVELGLDHFLSAPDIDLRTGALTYTLIQMLLKTNP
ncbi:MAG: hypothetical protein HY036_03775 [Nitrospirae bacterium]|nr:hypothetical protein [Nitrospirota bacterium]